MAAQAEIRTTADQRLIEEASAIFSEAGFSLADAVHMLLLRTVADHALPFDPVVIGPETVAAVQAARNGEVERFQSLHDLMADLHAGD